MELAKLLNDAGRYANPARDYRRLDELEVGKSYPIMNFEGVDTRYNRRALTVTLDTSQDEIAQVRSLVYLPSRLAKMEDAVKNYKGEPNMLKILLSKLDSKHFEQLIIIYCKRFCFIGHGFPGLKFDFNFDGFAFYRLLLSSASAY